jgi:hypothetical protein
MKIYVLLITILISVISELDNLNLDPHIQKRTKVLACVSLAKSRMAQDVEFIAEMVKLINEHFTIEDGRNKLLSLALVNCYSRITLVKSLEVKDY